MADLAVHIDAIGYCSLGLTRYIGCDLVLVRVVPEVAHVRPLLMLAVARGHAPGGLERQQQHHDHDNKAAHGCEGVTR